MPPKLLLPGTVHILENRSCEPAALTAVFDSSKPSRTELGPVVQQMPLPAVTSEGRGWQLGGRWEWMEPCVLRWGTPAHAVLSKRKDPGTLLRPPPSAGVFGLSQATAGALAQGLAGTTSETLLPNEDCAAECGL